MESVTGKQSQLCRFKSRILSSSCLVASVPDPIADEIGRTNTQNEEVNESGASSSSSIPKRKKKTRFGSIAYKIGFRLGRMLSLGSTRSKKNKIEEIVTVETNAQQHDVATTNDNFLNVGVHDETMQNNRRIGSNWQEPLENSARFGRTLSVGRLRDRVLRRTLSNNVGLYGSEDRNGVDYNAQISETRVMNGGSRRVAHDLNSEYMRGPPYRVGGLENESIMMQFRDGNGHELLEQRSLFIERRRRIRSQVRALQRLGSRFENLSGHERSCILSGRHRTGRCSCRESNHVVNDAERNTGTRSSISRIVLLAEALFEVLDEIHQHSVALTSHSSYSSLGSIPAPKEAVECMPVKVYRGPQEHQNEEAARCYICLLEYEDGDHMRILPCNHEFHQACVDKWLKEIHRVCPLCRGDVCRSGVFGADKIT